jgi:hypothetical protein
MLVAGAGLGLMLVEIKAVFVKKAGHSFGSAGCDAHA